MQAPLISSDKETGNALTTDGTRNLTPWLAVGGVVGCRINENVVFVSDFFSYFHFFFFFFFFFFFLNMQVRNTEDRDNSNAERRTPDRRVSGSSPGMSGGSQFSSPRQLSVLTLISVSDPPPCYRSST